MSIINISFDTKTKKCVATIDGTQLADVSNISIFKDYDDPEKSYIDLQMRSKIKDESVVVYTNITASHSLITTLNDPILKDVIEYRSSYGKKILLGAYALMGKKPPK